ncbi:MAG: hypothetical protein IKC65_04770 [Lentisphaeria bacterium]|nr:hypothetical protein [Lentisphaeria bacterium]
MISQPGDNRTALIAALIAIPAACLVTMAIHTFVPVSSSTQAAVPVTAGREFSGNRGFKGKHFSPEQKEAMRKKFAEARKARMDALKQIAALAQKRAALLAKNPKASPKEVILAQTESLLAQGTLFRAENKIRIMGTPFSDTAVRAAAFTKIAAADKAALKKDKGCEIAALQNEIEALELTLQVKNNRLFRKPDWKNAYGSFLKNPGAEQLQALYIAEAENQPPRRFGR